MNGNGRAMFAKYVGVLGLLALAMTSAIVVLFFLKIDAPKVAWILLGVVWAFYSIKNGRNVAAAVGWRPL
jgi:hypothetical protein